MNNPGPLIEAAIEMIDRIAQRFGGGNMTFALFEVGKEIPLRRETVETPQPAKTQVKFHVGEKS